MGGAIPLQVVLDCINAEQAVRNQPISSTPPWPLLQFLPPGPCLEFPALKFLLDSVGLSTSGSKRSTPQAAFDHGTSPQQRDAIRHEANTPPLCHAPAQQSLQKLAAGPRVHTDPCSMQFVPVLAEMAVRDLRVQPCSHYPQDREHNL